ncbi:MAG: class II aldolase/adducin family protein [Planctomycetia bacterium]|jgi:L-fuculose-phosphate aldolase
MLNLHTIKKEICEIGSRLYKKGFASANDGNISYRASEKEVVCTPTGVSKGFLKPDDLCVVDMQGNQTAGRKKRTSEILLHLEIMKERPEVKSIVHCHPPHATAFGIAREPIPPCVLPEIEIFLGEVPIARYGTPGSKNFAETILPFVNKSEVVILANHGTVSWGDTVEAAYFKTEMLDAYCKMLMLAKSLGRITYFNKQETEELLDVKQSMGIPDPRIGAENCDLCANDVFRSSWSDAGVQQQAFSPPSFRTAGQGGSTSVDQESLIQAITDRVLEAMTKKG